MFPNPALTNNLGILAQIVQDVSIVIGLMLVLGSIFKFKRYSETRMHMTAQLTLATPVMMVVAGVILLCLPAWLKIFLRMIWGTDQLDVGGSGVFTPMIMLMRVTGVMAFIRGWMILAKHSGEHAQPGMVSKGFMHVIGGILSVNVVGTAHIVRSLLGLG